MKTIKKKPSRAHSRKKDHYEEDIFNPFAPITSAMQNWLNGPRRESAGSFRNAFITVLLLHIIAVLAVMTFGAFRKTSALPSTAKQTVTSKTEKSNLSEILQKAPPAIVANNSAKPGQKLEPIREEDPFSPKSAKVVQKMEKPSPIATGETPTFDTLPPLAAPTTPKPSDIGANKSEDHSTASTKRAFLEATGRRMAPNDINRANEVAIKTAQSVTATNKSEATEQPTPSEYVVKSGDNIFTISRKMNVSFTELAAANKLSGPRDIRVGQTLVRPSTDRL